MNEQVVDDVYSLYGILKGSLKIARSTIHQDLHHLHRNIPFVEETKDQKLNELVIAKDELNDVMVLSLFAAFERELRLSIQNVLNQNTSKPNSTVKRLSELTTESVERWTINDLINSLKDIVETPIRSKVKQIYEYRNWIAHGKNPNNIPSASTDPKVVWEVLKEFIKQASVAI